MEKVETLEKTVKFRLFSAEFNKVLAILRYKKDKFGGKKYQNLSHLCRCALIKLIKEDYLGLDVRGRPLKRGVNYEMEKPKNPKMPRLPGPIKNK